MSWLIAFIAAPFVGYGIALWLDTAGWLDPIGAFDAIQRLLKRKEYVIPGTLPSDHPRAQEPLRIDPATETDKPEVSLSDFKEDK